jgi:hypothetical protein
LPVTLGVKNKMGIFSVRKDSHPTFRKPWSPKCVKLLLLWLVYLVRVSPTLSSRNLSVRNLAASSFLIPGSVIISDLGVLLRNKLPPVWICECCPPYGFLLSFLQIKEQAFYHLLEGSNILSSLSRMQLFRLRILNNLLT